VITKCFEVRDRATFVPVLAVKMNYPQLDERQYMAQRYLLARCGYPRSSPHSVLLTKLAGDGRATADPYAWGDRTFTVAHGWILDNFDALENGAVVDVEFLLGESESPKRSERETSPP
jgi:hypothetical protein